MTSPSDHRFQVDLGGMIDLLANHLYSSPRVYIRELLQNGIDAITARRLIEPDHPGAIRLEIVPPAAPGAPPTLIVEDDGVGLTDDEIHRFLATIGQSSKRGYVEESRHSFIGQFGIGLLSCFMVCDEIIAISRSAREPDAPVMEWRGRPDGTYSIRRLDSSRPPGTQLYLRGKADCAELMTLDAVRDLARYFGELLPVPVTVSDGEHDHIVNPQAPPWRRRFPSAAAERQELLRYGKVRFDTDFFDAIPLRSDAGGVDGVAYILPTPTSFSARQQHRVYLKNMLLTEQMENLLPEWAFFVQCVVNADGLRPTASRESFYEDETLAKCQATLGHQLERYLADLAGDNPDRMRELVSLHHYALMALAVENLDLLRLFADHLPFETTAGRLTLREIRDRDPQAQYVRRSDRFNQVAPVAKAQGRLIINACYTNNVDVLERLPELNMGYDFLPLDTTEFSQQFNDLTPSEDEHVAALLTTADRVLNPLNIQAEVRRFLPDTLPAIFFENDAAEFLRSAARSRDVTTELFAGLLDTISAGRLQDARSKLCLNYDNPLIQKLADNPDTPAAETALKLLYVQALLLGHYPMTRSELDMLTAGMDRLIDLAL